MRMEFKKHIIENGIYKQVECKNHSFRWSGKMPCTGIYCCVFCGKEKSEIEKQNSEKEN